MPLPPYPETLIEFHQMFPDDAACEDYLVRLRWPDGFCCPQCGGATYWKLKSRRVIECKQCHHQICITAGTMMHRTHSSILKWFYGVFLTSTLTPGMSSVQFQKQMGFKRNETAFTMLHKIRSAMVNTDREPLHGIVEVDETYVGGEQRGKGRRGRSLEGKMLIVGAVELRHRKKKKVTWQQGERRELKDVYAGRIRLRVIANASAKELESFLLEHVSYGTEVATDGWAGYYGVPNQGYRHIVVTDDYSVGETGVLPMIHREFGNLKTWLLGTHHGRVEPQHIQAYLNEFCFRHNRRFWRFSAFQRVLLLGMNQFSPTYDQLYASPPLGRGLHPNPPEEEGDEGDEEDNLC